MIKSVIRGSRYRICGPKQILHSNGTRFHAVFIDLISFYVLQIPPLSQATRSTPHSKKRDGSRYITDSFSQLFNRYTPNFENRTSRSSVHVPHDFIHLCVPKFIVQAHFSYVTFSLHYRPVSFWMRLLVPQLSDLPFLEFFLVSL